MRLEQQDAMMALDPDFGRMALEVGQHAWGLAALTMREKAFVFLAADLCAHATGFPLRTHVAMARSHGVPMESLREALRHLAPYAGYPTAAEALMVLAEIDRTEEADEALEVPDGAGGIVALDSVTVEGLRALDSDFARFLGEQMDARWNRPGLTPRERALCTIATDVCQGTLEDSLLLHVELARRHGAGDEQVRAVLLLVAEFGIAKAWRAYQALADGAGGNAPAATEGSARPSSVS